MQQPRVSIVIVNWNGLEDTARCLESLKGITYRNYEVVVVDNGSEGDDAAVLEERYAGWVHLIRKDRNCGFAVANNSGIVHALRRGNDYVLLLNNDTTVDPEFLERLVEVAESEASIGIVGPKMYYMERPDVLCFAGGRVRWCLGLHFHRGNNRKDTGQFDDVTDTDFITGACMLVKTSVIQKVGLLPTDYFLQWEDIDYCTAARREGFKCVYAPPARIWHRLSASFRREGMRGVQLGYGIRAQILCRHKYLSTPQFICFLLCFAFVLTPGRVVWYLLHGGRADRIGNLIKGTWLGIKDVSRKQTGT